MHNLETNPNNPKTAVALDLISQVEQDLTQYINQFPNKTFALRNLSNESQLNEKTLRRLLKKENSPSAHTLHKLYYVMTHSNSEEELLSLCPKVVKEQLEKLSTDKLKKETPKRYNFLELIESDPIVGEVYMLLGTKNLDLSEVVYRFGQYGADVLMKLNSLGIIVEVDKGLYAFSEKQPHLDGDILKSLGLRLTKRYMKPEVADLEGESYMSLYCEGLNAQGKKKWLEIDQKAFQEKVKVANDSLYKGQEPMFTFQVTDNLNETVRERKS